MRRRRHGFEAMALPLAALAAVLSAATAGHAQESLPDGYIRPGPVQAGQAPGMQVEERSSSARVFEVRFGDGDEILSGLTELAETHGITSAHITGLGGLTGATLGFGDPSIGAFVFREISIDEKAELVSLVGSISMRDGEPYVHLHAVVAVSDGGTTGGHVLAAHVSPVAEVSVVATATAER